MRAIGTKGLLFVYEMGAVASILEPMAYIPAPNPRFRLFYFVDAALLLIKDIALCVDVGSNHRGDWIAPFNLRRDPDRAQSGERVVESDCGESLVRKRSAKDTIARHHPRCTSGTAYIPSWGSLGDPHSTADDTILAVAASMVTVVDFHLALRAPSVSCNVI